MKFFRRYTSLVLPSLLALASLSCDQSFDPGLQSNPIPIVYSILGTEKEQQFVKVYTQFNSSQFVSPSSAIEIPVTDAIVTLNDGANFITLRDTTLPRPANDRYSNPIHAYVAIGTSVQFGGRYSLHIQSSTVGEAFSSISVPSHSLIYLSDAKFLEYPHDYFPDDSLTVSVYLQPGAKGAVLRMMLCYEVLGQNGWELSREEVPVYFEHRPRRFDEAIYGTLRRLNSLSVRQYYWDEAYRILLVEISTRTYPSKLVFTSVVVQFVQFEENLYNYYNIVSGFRDKFSIRLDHAGYSNISGGTGLFGAYAVDSLVQILPYDFIYNRR